MYITLPELNVSLHHNKKQLILIIMATIKSQSGDVLFTNNEANLVGADLIGADLRNADLRGAYLINADLSYADLHGANLNGANILGANLSGVKHDEITSMFRHLSPDGEFTAWEKCRGKIVKLLIPSDAKRSNATSLKCRCDKAMVVEIQELDGSISELREVASNYDGEFVYKVVEVVSVDDFNDDRCEECTYGIHYFIDRSLAVNYQLNYAVIILAYIISIVIIFLKNNCIFVCAIKYSVYLYIVIKNN